MSGFGVERYPASFSPSPLHLRLSFLMLIFLFAQVNINGGAIAMGHPLGCTGARQVATGLSVAKQTGGRVFVTSMCIGSGMGMAAVFVSEH